jgi:hypothetical protein
MVAMTDAGTLLPSDRPLTVEDLYLLPDDGNRYELDDGLLVVSPALHMGRQRRNEYRLVAEVIGTDPFRATRPFSCEVVPAGLIPAAWRP